MQPVLDDRSAEGDAVFLALGLGLLVRIELSRRARTVVVRAVGAECFAAELIGARAAERGDRRARDLVVLRLVVRRDDLVFTDGELRERIALRVAGLAAHARTHVALLAHAVDIEIHAIPVLRATADFRTPAAVDFEHDARNGVGELEEIAGDLRHGLDLVLRDRRADLRGAHLAESSALNGDFLHRCVGGFDRAARCREIERRGGSNTHGHGCFGARARVHAIGARRKSGQRVIALSVCLRAARRARGDILCSDGRVGRRLAAQRGIGRLRPDDARGREHGSYRRSQNRSRKLVHGNPSRVRSFARPQHRQRSPAL